MKTTYVTALALLAAVSGFALMAPAPMGTTVLVVPARYSVLQVAFDVSDRMGAALIAYQGDPRTPTPVIDYWAGQEWKRLSLEDYAQGAFLQGRISRFIVVGSDEILPPVLVSSVSGWCENIERVSSLDTPGLVNAFGKAFNFTPADWEWFARRYNLQLADRNAERRQTSWYDRDYYDDELAHRWQWLRRKYNPPAGAPQVTPSEPLPEPPVEPATKAEAVAPLTPQPSESPAPSDEEKVEIERLDVPIVEPAAPPQGAEDAEPAPQGESSSASQDEHPSEAAEVNEPAEETWPVK